MSISRISRLAAIPLGCAALIGPTALANAAETVNLKASFSPDQLNVPTNVSGSATIHSTTGRVPSPLTKVSVIGPAGLSLDVAGTGTCNAGELEDRGPSACPADSRAGFGHGLGLFELASQVIEEKFTMDLFRGPNQNGHVVVLVYVNAVYPVSVQLVFKAPVIKEHKPYGLGFGFEVPLIPTLPGASDASVGSATLTIGARNVAYYKKVHGKRKLFHVSGIITPKSCPAHGFPVETILGFQDGSQVAAKTTVPCPKKKR